MIPAIRQRDLLPRVAGIRAQSILDDGSLVDDFLIEKQPNTIHVINAPSPAATACLTIAEQVSAMVACDSQRIIHGMPPIPSPCSRT